MQAILEHVLFATVQFVVGQIGTQLHWHRETTALTILAHLKCALGPFCILLLMSKLFPLEHENLFLNI